MSDRKESPQTEPEKVRPFRRERLEPEIVAMSVEIDDDQDPALIVNIDDPDAKNAIKRILTWLFGLGGLIEWARRSANRPIMMTVAGTATAASIATFAVTEITRDGTMERRPQTITQQTLTAPPATTVTTTLTPTKSSTAGAPPQEEGGRLPTAGAAPPWHSAADASSPQARATPPPTRRTRAPRPTVEASSTQPPQPTDTSEVTEQGRPLNAGAQTPAEPEPEPTAAPDPPQQTDEPGPAPAPSPTPAAADCDGLVEVVLDPLLDLCLLG